MERQRATALVLLGLVVMAVLGTLWMGDGQAAASSSPLQSPLPTYEYFPSPIDGPLPPTVYYDHPLYSPIPTPTATPAVPVCCDGWRRLGDWMGQYRLWTEGTMYYVEVY